MANYHFYPSTFPASPAPGGQGDAAEDGKDEGGRFRDDREIRRASTKREFVHVEQRDAAQAAGPAKIVQIGIRSGRRAL